MNYFFNKTPIIKNYINTEQHKHVSKLLILAINLHADREKKCEAYLGHGTIDKGV